MTALCDEPWPGPSGERGITLIEVIIALTILSIVLMSLGGLMFQVGWQAQQSAAATYRAAAMTTANAWVEVLPWDSIDPSVGCTSDSSGLLAYDRCVTVVNTGPRLKQVTVVINPTGTLTARPETLVVLRSLPRPNSPFR